MSICFAGFSIVFAVLMFLRRKELIDVLFPLVFLKKDCEDKDAQVSKIKYIIISFIFKIFVLFFAWCILLSEHNSNIYENIFISVIVTIILEWVGVSVAKICMTTMDRVLDTHDGRFLITSSIWVLLGTRCNDNWKYSWLSLIIILFIIINILVSLNYMMMLCIKREDFLKREFGEVSATNQVAAIILLVAVHIYSFAMLIHLLINSNMGLILLDNNKAIEDIWDILYYTIITYTTVGYGDITPLGLAARIVAVMISVTGFFMSVVVVGVILSTAIDKKNNT
jgi:uncharacterized membrane protein